MGGGGQDVVLVSGNGLAGLALGVSCSVWACGAWFTGAGGLASSLGSVRWEQLVSKALRPLRGGLRPAWAPAAAQRQVRLAGSKRKTSAGENRWPGWHAAPVRSV